MSYINTYNTTKDKDRDGRISYDEFCDRKTKTEIAFEVKQQKQKTKFPPSIQSHICVSL